MSKSNNPSSITVEEAVARMVNLEYIPEGFTLTDMTSAFLEEAEVEYENARIDRLPDDELAILKNRFDACEARHSLALLLLEHLRREISNPADSMVILSDDSAIEPRMTLRSVSSWASNIYGIGISEWPNLSYASSDGNDSAQDVRWEDVTIKIQANYRIAYSLKKGDFKRGKTFLDIGLMGRRRIEPNNLGATLIGLSQGKKFPKGKSAVPGDKTAISKLRNALKNLTGLSGDPFYAFNEGDGWMPRFKVIDDRRNADERAKRGVKPVSFNEARDSGNVNDFEDEDDPAGRYINKNAR